MALYSLLKITVLCALFHEAAAAVRRRPPCTCVASVHHRFCSDYIAPLYRVHSDVRVLRCDGDTETRTRLHRTQGTPACSGIRTEADTSSSPDGVYSQTNVEVPNIPQVQVKHIDVIFNQPQPFAGLQTYTLDLDACVVVGDMCMKIPDASAPFTDGRFIDTGSNQGSMFLPRASEPRNPINELLKIQWCPDQNYFLVKFAGQLLEPLRHQPSVFSTVAPHPDGASPPASPNRACSAF